MLAKFKLIPAETIFALLFAIVCCLLGFMLRIDWGSDFFSIESPFLHFLLFLTIQLIPLLILSRLSMLISAITYTSVDYASIHSIESKSLATFVIWGIVNIILSAVFVLFIGLWGGGIFIIGSLAIIFSYSPIIFSLFNRAQSTDSHAQKGFPTLSIIASILLFAIGLTVLQSSDLLFGDFFFSRLSNHSILYDVFYFYRP
jgi:hypothetical protein